MYGLDNNSGINVMPAIAPAVSSTPLWFTEGGANQPPSYPGQDWFNMVTAEVLNVLAEAEMTPDKSDLTQLSKAIKKIISSGSLLIKNNLGEIKAAGPVAIAQTLVNLGLGEAAKRAVGTGTNQIPDMGTFSSSLISAGWQKFPSGLILQWAELPAGAQGTPYTSYLPIPFPTTALQGVASYNLPLGSSVSIGVDFPSKSQVRMSNSGATQIYARVFVVGY